MLDVLRRHVRYRPLLRTSSTGLRGRLGLQGRKVQLVVPVVRQVRPVHKALRDRLVAPVAHPVPKAQQVPKDRLAHKGLPVWVPPARQGLLAP